MAEKLATVRAAAAARGRRLRFGMRLHLIVRETDEAAWAQAEQLTSRVSDAKIAEAQARYAAMDSVGQQRQAALHSGRRDRL